MTHIACIVFCLLSVALSAIMYVEGQSDTMMTVFAFWMLSLAITCVCSMFEDYNWRDY